MRPWLALPLLAALSVLPARAQDGESAFVTGEESEALAALRRAEMEMFGRRQALVEVPQITVGVPSAVRSTVEFADEGSRGGPTPWLEGLHLPDLPVRFHERVVRYLEYFREDRRGRNLMSAWLRRSTRYGSMIRSTLRQSGLPEDLRCVAMAESGFDPTIRSRRGAVGMWQFVARTGREYGLRQSRWFDERMDPIKSTRAAARMLGDLHRRLGSWELALAAYNMGYGALLRAIRKYNTNDYWTLAELEAGLPFETTIYVAKIMACAVVMRNTDAFGYGELTHDPPMEVEPFEVPGGVRLAQLARAAGVSVEEIAALNPELLRGRTPPSARTYEIRIPAGQSERFARAWSRLRPRDPAHRPYVIRFGETLAQVARRFRTTVRDLRTLNDSPEGEDLGAGTTILVPAVAPREDEVGDPPVVAVPQGRFHYPGRRRVFYRVSSGDSLWRIARFFGVRPDEIARWNQLDPAATLHRGMFLQLFVPRDRDLSRALVLTEDQVRVVTVGTEEFFDEHEARQGRVRFRYRVVEGDTLASIGRRFGLSVGSLARINRFSRRIDLQVGQEIIVYAEESHVPARFRTGGRNPSDRPDTEANAASAQGSLPRDDTSVDDTSADDTSADDTSVDDTEDIADDTEDIADDTEDIADDTEDSADDTEDIADDTEDSADDTEDIADDADQR